MALPRRRLSSLATLSRAGLTAAPEQSATVTLIIPLHHSAAYLQNCLAALGRQTYPHALINIHFLGNHASPQARRSVREFSKAHPLFRVRRRPAKAPRRPRAAAITNPISAEWIVAVHPNATLADDFVEKLMAEAQAGQYVFLGGRVIYQTQGYFSRAMAAVLGSAWTVPIATQDLSAAAERVEGCKHPAVRAGALQQAGVLEHEMLGNEYEVAARLTQQGHRCHFSPAIISHAPLKGHFLHLIGHALWHGYAWSNRLRKQPSIFRLRYAVPGLMLLIFLLLALGALFDRLAWAHVFSAAAAYGLYNLFVAFSLAAKQRWPQLPLLPFLLAAYHAAFGAGSIAGLLTAKKWGSAIPKWLEKSAVVYSDYLALNAAFLLWTFMRARLGLFSFSDFEPAFIIANLIFVFWFLLFLLFGLYRAWNAASRFDEALAVCKTTALGLLLIFLVTFDLERDWNDPLPKTRMLLLSYGLLVAGAVITGRMIVRTVQRQLLESGLGLRRTVIAGWGQKARELYSEVSKYPALGFQVVGFVGVTNSEERKQFQGVPLLGRLPQLAQIIRKHEVEEVLIALQQHDQKILMQIIAQTDGLPVNLKIVPDLYSIITGQARTNQIYGFPLIEILPQYMPAWERVTKRAMDVAVSGLILLLGFPFWILLAAAIRLDSPGPVFYRQERMGKDGRLINIIKFRSMVANAEKLTGPKWADKDDPRITRVGKFMRKWRLDEIPQFINVLRGDMSIVGPRPERPFFVEKLRQEYPLYARRLRVQPGITGWAQVKGEYDTTIENVQKKLQYDLFYLENMSLKMDLKIILHTIYVMLAGRGQ